MGEGQSIRLIRNALQRLLGRSNQDAFVILELSGTSKFVQFAGSQAEPLLLDLPVQTLSPDELSRAIELFRQRGIELVTYDTFDAPGDAPVGTQLSFQAVFGRDVEDATTMTAEIFRKVYLASPAFQLTVTEN